MKTILVKRVEKIIGLPTEKWKGKCHEIAYLMLENGLCTGKLRYGHFLGEIAPTSIFVKNDIGFCRHGWVEKNDGTIVDPIRWVFEDVEPYIYVDDNNDEYEFGGNEMRAIEGAPQATGKLVTIRVSWVLLQTIQTIFDCYHNAGDQKNGKYEIELGTNQLFWLANANPKILGKAVKEMYEEFDRLNMTAFVPIDNYRVVKKGEVFV